MPPVATPPLVDGVLSQSRSDTRELTEVGEIFVSEEVFQGDATKVSEVSIDGMIGVESCEEQDRGQDSQSLCEMDPKEMLPKIGSVEVVSQKEEKSKFHSSWVSMVKNEKELEKVELVVEEVDGIPTARIPNNVFEEAHPLWENFLVGRFLAKAPFVGGIHALVNKIWTLGDRVVKIDVYVVDKTTVRFRINDERTRSRVLRRGMWNLCGVPVVLTKWSAIVDTEQEEIKTIPLWVIVKNVPPKYFSWKVLSAITSPLGTPNKLHSDTEACKSFDEGKVFVEVDLTKDLPKKFSFKSEKGGDTIVEFVYPWLPPRCHTCSKWGHQTIDCLAGRRINHVGEVATKVHENNEEERKIQTEVLVGTEICANVAPEETAVTRKTEDKG